MLIGAALGEAEVYTPSFLLLGIGRTFSMSDTNSANAPSGAARPAPSAGRILAIVLPIALVLVAAYWWSKGLESQARSDVASTMVARIFPTSATTGSKLEFPDADNDMVADLPTDATKLITPDTLVFSYVATAEEEGPSEDTWKELFAAIKEKTGKEVKFTHFTTADEQTAALKNGELHIVGLNTGLVQSAVEQDGFVPLCTLGRGDGSWGYTMEFIVPAGSPIKKLEDIKGHKVIFTTVDSNSGCKAPLVLLKDKCNLLPERDYKFGFSLGHKESIKGIATKETDYDVAPVASDVLARMKEKQEVDPATYVSIHTSERFPPATFGYAYNLSPELRDGIKDAMLNFDWKGTGLETQFGPEGKEKFVPVSYKDDWANTRRIDQVIAEARRASASENAPAKSGT
jgi:phosphonate transport system substrate-binding protein